MSEHAELIENAWVAYLLAIDPLPWLPSLSDDGGSFRIYAGENNLARDGQNIICYVDGDLGSEEPPLSGNRTGDVVIRLRTPVVKQVKDTDYDWLASHKAMADALQTSVLSIILPDDLTGAIGGFCCFGIIDRAPFREQDANSWTSGWRVKLHSCPSTIAP